MEKDPEDLSAVYNLMLIYQEPGKRDESAANSKEFRQLKDDPETSSLANQFLK